MSTLDAAIAGDRAAIERLLREQLPQIRRTLLRYLGAGPDLDDVTQQTLLALVAALPGFRGECALATFVHRIAVRQAWALLRQNRRVIPLPPALPSPATPDRALALEELSGLLLRLSPERRMAFVLHDVEGHSAREIAALLDLPEGTVNSRLREARQALRSLLSPASAQARVSP